MFVALVWQSRMGRPASPGWEGRPHRITPDLKLCVDSELNNPSRMEPYATWHRNLPQLGGRIYPADPCCFNDVHPSKNPKPWAFHTQLDPSQVLKQVTWGLLGSKKNATGLIYPRLV
jgi:hypothetical protein